MKDVWLIGDDFLNNMYSTLAQMKNTAKLKKKPAPYVYDYYNVKCFTTNLLSLTHTILARLVNCVTKGLNDTNKLPRFMVIMPDGNIIEFLNEFGDSMVLIVENALDWIIHHIEHAVTCKKEELFKRKPGAVASTSEPKIVWVKMINRPTQNRLLNVRSKFNQLLENNVVDKPNHYIMDVNQALFKDPGNYFTHNNELNDVGKVRYWFEVDSQLEEFDLRQRSLHPVYQEFRQNKNLQYQGAKMKYRLPPIPSQYTSALRSPKNKNNHR